MNKDSLRQSHYKSAEILDYCCERITAHWATNGYPIRFFTDTTGSGEKMEYLVVAKPVNLPEGTSPPVLVLARGTNWTELMIQFVTNGGLESYRQQARKARSESKVNLNKLYPFTPEEAQYLNQELGVTAKRGTVGIDWGSMVDRETTIKPYAADFINKLREKHDIVIFCGEGYEEAVCDTLRDHGVPDAETRHIEVQQFSKGWFGKRKLIGVKRELNDDAPLLVSDTQSYEVGITVGKDLLPFEGWNDHFFEHVNRAAIKGVFERKPEYEQIPETVE